MTLIDQLEAAEDNDPFNVYKPVQISRRDYFAAMALSGLLSNDYTEQTHLDIAKEAIKYADKMIAELDLSLIHI